MPKLTCNLCGEHLIDGHECRAMSTVHEHHRAYKMTLFSCNLCSQENFDMLKALVEDIKVLEKQRDGLGRHTNVSGEMESLMSKHERLFDLLK